MQNVKSNRRTHVLEVAHETGVKLLKKLKRNSKLYSNLEIDVDTTIQPRIIIYKNGQTRHIDRMKITVSYDIKTKGTT